MLATVVAVRMLWVMPMALLPRLVSRKNAPSARGALVVSWAGMRGVVSLAAAFAIPLTTNAGAPFPARAEILFLTFVVVVGTLLLQGLTLPGVIRFLGVQRDAEARADALAEAAAQHDAATAAVNRLDELVADDPPLTEQAAEVLRRLTQHRNNAAWERLGRDEAEVGESPSTAFRRLRREMLAAERELFLDHRDDGRIDDEVLRRVLHELDQEEALLDRD